MEEKKHIGTVPYCTKQQRSQPKRQKTSLMTDDAPRNCKENGHLLVIKMNKNALNKKSLIEKLSAENDLRATKSHESVPESILRRSGSSNCLKQTSSRCTLQSCFDSTESAGQHTVTIVNTKSLPNYSTERYYMLSELEMKAHSIAYLCDWNDGEDLTQYTSSCSSVSSFEGPSDGKGLDERQGSPKTDEAAASPNDNCEERQLLKLLPPAIIIYLLWPSSCIQYTNPQSFAQGPVHNCVQAVLQKLQEESNNSNDGVLHSSVTSNLDDSQNGKIKRNRIYVIVDRLFISNSLNQKISQESLVEPKLMDTGQEGNQKSSLGKEHDSISSNKSEIAIAETLAKYIAKSNLRTTIEGVMVGVSSNLRAAPGLEACLNAVSFGEPERRGHTKTYQKEDSNKNDPKKSCIGIVTANAEQMMGLDVSRETDAVQNLTLHHLTCAEWSGYGDLNSFAARGQKMWRRQFAESFYDHDKNDEDFDDVDSMAYAVSSNVRKRFRKRNSFSQGNFRVHDHIDPQVEIISNIMVTVCLLIFWSHIWVTYGKFCTEKLWDILTFSHFKDFED